MEEYHLYEVQKYAKEYYITLMDTYTYSKNIKRKMRMLNIKFYGWFPLDKGKWTQEASVVSVIFCILR